MTIDLSDARPLRQSEVTPTLQAAAEHVLRDPRLPLGAVVLVAPGIAARVETHTNPTPQNQTVHPHRGVALYHIGPHAETEPMHATLAEGIDLSSYQAVADMDAVARSGRTFAYVRSADGLTHEDVLMAEHYRAAGEAGLLRGCYHLLRPSRSSSDQVGRFVERIAAVEDAYGRAELPPCLDVEVLDGVDPAGVAAAVARAVESLAALGRRPLVYAASGFWDALPAAGLAHVPALADLWVAHWGVRAPRLPRGWTEAKLWQYSATANVPGVPGRMDVNRALVGDLDALRAWGAGG